MKRKQRTRISYDVEYFRECTWLTSTGPSLLYQEGVHTRHFLTLISVIRRTRRFKKKFQLPLVPPLERNFNSNGRRTELKFLAREATLARPVKVFFTRPAELLRRLTKIIRESCVESMDVLSCKLPSDACTMHCRDDYYFTTLVSKQPSSCDAHLARPTLFPTSVYPCCPINLS